MSNVQFPVSLANERTVITTEERAQQAQMLRDLYRSLTEDHHQFKVGDIVAHKDNMCITKAQNLQIILEILDTPIVSTVDKDGDETPVSPYANRTLDVRALHMRMTNSDEPVTDPESDYHVFAHLHESRRFRPATEEELASPEGQLMQGLADKLKNPDVFTVGDILMSKKGCDYCEELDLALYIGIDSTAVRWNYGARGNSTEGEIFDTIVAIYHEDAYEIIRLPRWTLELWDGSEASIVKSDEDEDEDDTMEKKMEALMRMIGSRGKPETYDI